MLDMVATRALIAAHSPFNALEAFNQENMLRLIETSPTPPITRKHFLPGHLTASAWVVARQTRRVLLVHHAKSGLWFQPGGHIEDEDNNIIGAAIREVIEECGFQPNPVAPPYIFDLDIHGINAHKDEPDHLHFDIRSLILLDGEPELKVSNESKAVRWVGLDEARGLMRADTSNARYFKKTPLLFAA